jgi:hypothetical protein
MEEELLAGRLLHYDAKELKFRIIEFDRDPLCKACALIADQDPRAEPVFKGQL